jgi:hypothetical protein
MEVLIDFAFEPEYSIREGDEDAIIKVAAFHRGVYDRKAISFEAGEHAPVIASLSAPLSTTTGPTCSLGLGALRRLPIELLREVLLTLDMGSLFRIRHVSSELRAIVHSLREYQAVVAHGLDALCALLRTGAGSNVSLPEFYHTLHTKFCTMCGKMGDFVSLLPWRRCCFTCIRRWEMSMAPFDFLKTSLGLDNLEESQLTWIKTMPTKDATACAFSNVRIASVHQAVLVGNVEQERADTIRRTGPRPDPTFAFMAACALPYYSKKTHTAELLLNCVACSSNYDGRGGLPPVLRIYYQEEFLEHFQWCVAAQRLWEASR